MRLLSSAPDGATRTTPTSVTTTPPVIAIRMREWYATDDADLDGDERDVLEITSTADEPVDGFDDFVGNGAIGLHIHDDAATPGETTLGPLPYFSAQPFQSGVDVFLPASDPTATARSRCTNIPRGDSDDPRRSTCRTGRRAARDQRGVHRLPGRLTAGFWPRSDRGRRGAGSPLPSGHGRRTAVLGASVDRLRELVEPSSPEQRRQPAYPSELVGGPGACPTWARAR